MPKNADKRRAKYKSSESESSESDHSDRSGTDYSQSDHSESDSSTRSHSSESDRSQHERKKVQKKPVSKPKEEEKPKHKTSYQLFCDKERKKIAKEHPHWKLSEMSKELGKRWNALDDKKKRAFARKAAKAKEESD
jgi:hypothetical protein